MRFSEKTKYYGNEMKHYVNESSRDGSQRRTIHKTVEVRDDQVVHYIEDQKFSHNVHISYNLRVVFQKVRRSKRRVTENYSLSMI